MLKESSKATSISRKLEEAQSKAETISGAKNEKERWEIRQLSEKTFSTS